MGRIFCGEPLHTSPENALEFRATSTKGEMAMTLRLAIRSISALALLATLAAPAPAQNYPDRPIRMIVSIAAGSLTDVIMRAAANELSPRLGQPIVIDNKGCAACIPSAQSCAQSAGDGYTVCVVFH